MNKKGKIALIAIILMMAVVVISLAVAKPGVRAAKACNDEIDNDGDGYVDWPNDPGCRNANDNSELNSKIECDDGIDNDGDSAIDYNDGGCTGPTDNDETDCGDGVCEGPETQQNCPEDCGYPDSCSDTDGGIEPLYIGTVSGYLYGELYSYTDYCFDNTTLMEYYCVGDYEYITNASCIGNITTVCSNGECI